MGFFYAISLSFFFKLQVYQQMTQVNFLDAENASSFVPQQLFTATTNTLDRYLHSGTIHLVRSKISQKLTFLSPDTHI